MKKILPVILCVFALVGCIAKETHTNGYYGNVKSVKTSE